MWPAAGRPAKALLCRSTSVVWPHAWLSFSQGDVTDTPTKNFLGQHKFITGRATFIQVRLTRIGVVGVRVGAGHSLTVTARLRSQLINSDSSGEKHTAILYFRLCVCVCVTCIPNSNRNRPQMSAVIHQVCCLFHFSLM